MVKSGRVLLTFGCRRKWEVALPPTLGVLSKILSPHLSHLRHFKSVKFVICVYDSGDPNMWSETCEGTF